MIKGLRLRFAGPLLVSVGRRPLGHWRKDELQDRNHDGTEKVPTASKAVEVIKDELSEEGVVRVKVEPETDSPEDITASQAEIEERQRRERGSDRN
jgi:hypothetical protein